MGTISKAVEQQQAPNVTFGDILKSQMPKLAAVMPSCITPDRFMQIAISTYNKTPRLAECSITSILASLMQCAALGFEPSAVNGLGHFYIIPRWNSKTRSYEASPMIGYKGMLDLARRSGQIKSISARAVYKGDTFEYEFGTEERLYHVPHPGEKRDSDLEYVYCVVKFKDGGEYIDVMGRDEVDAIRKRFHTDKNGKLEDYGPWVTDYAAMARKTVLRRAFPYLPVSVEAQRAAAYDEVVQPLPVEIDFTGALPEPETEPIVEPEVIEDDEPQG